MRYVRLSTGSVRRLLLLVAASAFLLSAAHARPRPGLYLSLGGVNVGVCRDDPAGRVVGHGGIPMGWWYLAGGWSDEGRRVGFAVQDGKVYLYRSGMGLTDWLLW